MKKYIFIGLAVTASLVALAQNPVLESVKSGDKELVCNDKVVSVDKVVSFDDGTWIFVDGYAKNCEVR